MTFDRRVRSWRAAPCGREPSSSITAWTRAIVWGRTRCGEFSTFETVCRDTAASSATVSSVGRRSTGRLLASPAPSGTVLERSNGVVSANWNAQIDAPRMRRIDPVVKWWRGAAMQQPFLHDLLVAVAAPSQAWSAADGQIRPSGAQGVYHGDVRVLSRVEVCVGDVEPEVLSAAAAGPGTVEVVAALRSVDEAGADPTVRLRLRRRVTPDGMTEEITLEAGTGRSVRVPLRVTVGSDLARMAAVKAGAPTDARPVDVTADHLVWTGEGVQVTVAGPGAAFDATDVLAPALVWDLEVSPGEVTTVRWELRAESPDAPVLAGASGAGWSTPVVESDDRRLPALVTRSLDDLVGLRMRTRFAPDDVFLAAGAPWFFTLFGRDSLWAARMLLPLGTELAAGTLRTLAHRQGTTHDEATAEQPGRILHELRGADLELGEGTVP